MRERRANADRRERETDPSPVAARGVVLGLVLGGLLWLGVAWLALRILS